MTDGYRLAFADDFNGPDLDRAVWVPHYLPAWSSREATRATCAVRDSCLTLRIPPEQGLWCEGVHEPPLRVSAVQSGNFSGPVGSTVGQQPVVPGALVREEQPVHWGWTPTRGYLEMRARAVVSRRSMVAFWLVGLEDRPDRCAEICVAEMFGDALTRRTLERPATMGVGAGVHPFRDPRISDDFAVVQVEADIGEFHDYAVDWTTDAVSFFVDGRPIRSVAQAPAYPMQAMIAVFDFPERASDSDDPDAVPELVIDHVRGYVRE
jgi:hypothetical protein